MKNQLVGYDKAKKDVAKLAAENKHLHEDLEALKDGDLDEPK